MLEDCESTKPAGVSPLEHEKRWEKAKELRDILNDVRSKLVEYGDILAEVVGVPSLLPQQHKMPVTLPCRMSLHGCF